MRKSRIALELEVLSYPELEYYLTSPGEGLILIQDPDRFPSCKPEGFERQLRVRIGPDDYATRHPDARERLLSQARFALNFARPFLRTRGRIAIASPEGEVRAAGLTLGLMSALDFSTPVVEAFARGYPRASQNVRDAVLEAAGKLPPSALERASKSPLTKAALLLLARFTEGRISS